MPFVTVGLYDLTVPTLLFFCRNFKILSTGVDTKTSRELSIKIFRHSDTSFAESRITRTVRRLNIISWKPGAGDWLTKLTDKIVSEVSSADE